MLRAPNQCCGFFAAKERKARKRKTSFVFYAFSRGKSGFRKFSAFISVPIHAKNLNREISEPREIDS